MKTTYLVLLFLLVTSVGFSEEAGSEKLFSAECSVTAQYALAGSTLQEIVSLKKWIDSDPTNPKRSEYICKQIEAIKGYALAIQAITFQERDGENTEKFNMGGATGHAYALSMICPEAQKRGNPFALTTDEIEKIKSIANGFKKFLVSKRAAFAGAYPALRATH